MSPIPTYDFTNPYNSDVGFYYNFSYPPFYPWTSRHTTFPPIHSFSTLPPMPTFPPFRPITIPPSTNHPGTTVGISVCPILIISLVIRIVIRRRKRNERVARRHQQQPPSVSEGFVNITFIENENSSSIFPEAPPPYIHTEAPPKYDDIMKDQNVPVTLNVPGRTPTNRNPNGRPIAVHSSPPPYTIPI